MMREGGQYSISMGGGNRSLSHTLMRVWLLWRGWGLFSSLSLVDFLQSDCNKRDSLICQEMPKAAMESNWKWVCCRCLALEGPLLQQVIAAGQKQDVFLTYKLQQNMVQMVNTLTQHSVVYILTPYS